jgi:hypothetical protein
VKAFRVQAKIFTTETKEESFLYLFSLWLCVSVVNAFLVLSFTIAAHVYSV